jgi:transcriptional regulator with XRE-family HTH domain
MKGKDMVRWARAQAGLTQAELAARSGVPQPHISRIESGDTSPRVDTTERLLAECGFELTVRPRLGRGVDRTAIREKLALSVEQRAADLIDAVAALEEAAPGGV